MSIDQPSRDASASGNFLDEIVSFLNRDVTSFFSGKPTGNCTANMAMENTPQIAAPSEPLIEPLTDPHLLPLLAFQRKVLDWRDSAHADMTRTITTLYRAFIDHIDSRLEEVGLFSRLFADPADQVLLHDFILRIQRLINACLYRLEASLASLAAQEILPLKEPLSFRRAPLAAGYSCLIGLKFKPSERDKIVDRLQSWMLGPHGLAVGFRDQATHMADQLIQERHAC